LKEIEVNVNGLTHGTTSVVMGSFKSEYGRKGPEKNCNMRTAKSRFGGGSSHHSIIGKRKMDKSIVYLS
jgi:hypothetical protein